MPARAYWIGHVRLSLVSFGVRLFPAVSTSNLISFHQIHEPTGERVRYQKIVPEHGEVPNEEIVKGYEYERGHYVTFKEEELDELKVESQHTLALMQFVDRKEIDPIYFHRPYYVVPDGAMALEPYIVVRDALRQSDKVAIGQIVLSGKERIASLQPCGKGMLLETLRYDDEVREAEAYFEDIGDAEVEEEQVALAQQIIKSKSKPFDPSKFEDHYQQALREMVAVKLGEKKPEPVKAAAKPTNVVNLMDALKRSLAEPDGGGEAEAPKERKPAQAAKRRSSPAKSAGKGAKKGSGARKPAAEKAPRAKRRA